MLRYVLCVATVALALGLGLVVAAEKKASTGGLRAGVFIANLTPKKWPVPMNGSMTPRYATQAHDPVQARILVLEEGGTKMAFVTVDACLMPRDQMDAIKALATKTTGIPTSNICISATHTHTGVSLTPAFQTEAADKEYLDYMIAQVADGLKRANAALQPAQIGWGVAEEPRQVFNRRWFMKPHVEVTSPFGNAEKARMNPGPGSAELDKPTGPIDPQVVVLGLRSPDGKPIALLANYSLHYVGGMPGGGLSADYFAAFASKFAKKVKADELNPGFVAMMTNGTSGNINNTNFYSKVRPRQMPYEKIYEVAEDVANAAHQAWQKIQWRDRAGLKSVEREITFKVRKPSAEEIDVAKQILASAKRAPEGYVVDRPAIYANETLDMAKYPDTVKMKLQAHRIGELAVTTIPCEVFVEIGLELKAKNPMKPSFTISLANGYNGYLPTPEHHAIGGYETWRAKSSYLEEQASVVITKNLLEMLSEVAR